MSDVDQMPDVEGAVRTWLRSLPSINAAVGMRVFFGVPTGAVEATFPLITVQRVGGGDDGSDAPLDVALVQFDCWGSLDASGHGNKASATALVNTLRSALRTMDGQTALASGVTGFGARVESAIWAPDPDTDRPRYAVTAEITAISS